MKAARSGGPRGSRRAGLLPGWHSGRGLGAGTTEGGRADGVPGVTGREEIVSHGHQTPQMPFGVSGSLPNPSFLPLLCNAPVCCPPSQSWLHFCVIQGFGSILRYLYSDKVCVLASFSLSICSISTVLATAASEARAKELGVANTEFAPTSSSDTLMQLKC